MATLLADPPPASSPEQSTASGTTAGSAAQPAPSTSSSQPTCANCHSPMAAGQHWCLVCGAGRPGSLAPSGPKRRSAALVLGATAILVAGAAASAYAAWGEPSSGPRHVVEIVQLAPTASAPATTPPAAIGPPTTIKPTPTPPNVKTPKAPPATATPKLAATNASPNTTSTSTPQSTPASPKPTTPASPEPISLDTNAASNYNPYAYPAARFGDPTLAIDGDPSTSWNAQVNPVGAPKMAEGLILDLKTARKLSALLLITSTPGIRIQVYASKAATPPSTITDPAWIQLSSSQLVKNRHIRVKLRDSTKAFRFVTLWISKAPPGSTPLSPGHASVNEVELLPG